MRSKALRSEVETPTTDQVSPDEAVELRIHGVSGTPPQDMLGDEHPKRIAGDDTAGFYRGGSAQGRTLEAYSWGGLTSRKGMRSFWLLLLPFSLANLVGWMVDPKGPDDPAPAHPLDEPRPPTSGVATAARWELALVRVAALGITLLFFVWLAALTVDLIAFQCAAQEACTSGRGWLNPFTLAALDDQPNRRMLVGALAPLVALGGVLVAARSTRNRYEAYPLPETGDLKQARKRRQNELGRDGLWLGDPGFWHSTGFVRRATYQHVGATATAIAGLYALAVRLQAGPGGTAALEALAGIAGLVGALIILGMLVETLWPKEQDLSRFSRLWHAYWIAPLVLVGAAGIAGWRATVPAVTPGEIEPVFARAPVFTAMGILGLIGLLLVVRVIRWWPQGSWWTRVGPLVAGAVGLLLLVIWEDIGWRPLIARLMLAALFLFLLARLASAVEDQLLLGVSVAVVTSAVMLAWLNVAAAPKSMWVMLSLTGIAVVLTLFLARDQRWEAIVLGVAGFMVGLLLLSVWVGGDALRWIVIVTLAAFTLPTLAAEVGRKDRFRWAPSMVGVGLALVTLMAAVTGSVVRLADYLDRDDDQAALQAVPVPEIATLDVHQAVSLLIVGGLVVLLVGAVGHLVRVWADQWRPLQAAVEAEYADEEPDSGEVVDSINEVVKGALLWRSIATAVRDADVLLTVFVALPVLGAAVGMVRLVTGEGGDLWLIDAPELRHFSWLATGATWITSLLPLLGVLAVRAAQSNDGFRRKIGVAWDLTTFWPRRFHPLGPPSYAERAVPELGLRVEQLSREPGSRLLLSGHSQGSVLAAAVAAQQVGPDGGDVAARGRTVLFTYGSPLARFYRRFFPGYFGGGVLRWLRSEYGVRVGGRQLVDGWWNVHRLTDPIGEAVFTGPDEDVTPSWQRGDLGGGDHVIPDPASRFRFPLNPPAPVRNHTGYSEQSEMEALVHRVATASGDAGD